MFDLVSQGHIKFDKVQYWLDQGAQPTDTVKSLLAKNKTAPVATAE